VSGLAAGTLAACSGGAASSSDGIPQPAAAPSTSAPNVTTPQGGPALAMFNAPTSFSCLTQDPAQAQVTIGWDAPSATQVTVTLDGVQPPRGIRASVPYEVPAGPPRGPGVTVVFACGAPHHTIRLRWTMNHSPGTMRVVSVAAAP